MQEFTTDLGTRITLGAEIGEGGEGHVSEIVGRPGYIAKIYHEPPSLELVSKLHALRKVTEIEDVSNIAAIPKSLLKNNEGKVVGFYMKQIQGCHPIHEVYGFKSRKIHLSDWDFRHLVALAKNVALGFARLHKHNIIIGDVNENSILVSSKCLARFIDTDSFQIRENDKVYRCKVGVVDYTAPENQPNEGFRQLCPSRFTVSNINSWKISILAKRLRSSRGHKTISFCISKPRGFHRSQTRKDFLEFITHRNKKPF